MRKKFNINCLFLDIGGVLLTNGWDHLARKRAAIQFKLDWEEMEAGHHLNFETYEIGKLTLDEYLDRVIFHRKRPFTKGEFRDFMFAQSKALSGMRELMGRLKVRYGLKVAVVSNEGLELNAFRISQFKLSGLVDFFVSSCFIHMRKPDSEIFRIALDMAQVPAGQILYVENTPLFAQVAEGFGIHSLVHTDLDSTAAKMASFGLADRGGRIT